MIVNDTNARRKVALVSFAICAACQVILAPNLPLANGRPNFMLIFAGSMALCYGGTFGILASFGAGLFFDIVSSGPVGVMAFLFTLMAAVIGREDRNVIADATPQALRIFCLAAPAVELASQLVLMAIGQGGTLLDTLGLRWLPASVLDIVFFLPFLLFLSRTGSRSPQLGKKKTGAHKRSKISTRGL